MRHSEDKKEEDIGDEAVRAERGRRERQPGAKELLAKLGKVMKS